MPLFTKALNFNSVSTDLGIQGINSPNSPAQLIFFLYLYFHSFSFILSEFVPGSVLFFLLVISTVFNSKGMILPPKS